MLVRDKQFTIGADPEIFIGVGSKFVSAHDKIPGTKQNPFPVDLGAIQVDGMAAEFNIDPASDYEQFNNNLNTVQKALKEILGAEFEFLHDCTVHFDEEFIKDIPGSALRLGCESDFNAWTGVENPSPNEAALMRTTGGHVHIGGFNVPDEWDFDHYLNCGRLCRCLDETLGVYSLLWDKDDNRRTLYGKAGSFRPKKYGVEYRTLSNQWIFKPELTKFVYDAVEEAIDKWYLTGYEPDEMFRNIIDSSDRNNPFFENNPKAEYIRSI